MNLKSKIAIYIWSDWTISIMLAGLAIAVRLAVASLLVTDAGDIGAYRRMGEFVIKGDNIYAPQVLFPYTPFSQLVPAAMLYLSKTYNLHFSFAIKLPCIFADGVATVIIFLFLRFKGNSLFAALAWTSLWIFNPVSILITAFHGNHMSIVACLMMASYVAIERGNNSSHRRSLILISGLLLGYAVAMRHFPIFLFPIYLILFPMTVVEAALFIVCVLAPSTLSTLPYFMYARESFLREITTYSGFTDFGWVSVLRAILYVWGEPVFHSLHAQIVQNTKLLFLFAYTIALCIIPLCSRKKLGALLLIAPLLFYLIYGAVSAQYLIWVITLGIVLQQRFAILFSLVSAICLVSFYTMFSPAILFGQFQPLIQPSRTLMLINAISNILLIAVSLAWMLSILELRKTLHAKSIDDGAARPAVLVRSLFAHAPKLPYWICGFLVIVWFVFFYGTAHLAIVQFFALLGK